MDLFRNYILKQCKLIVLPLMAMIASICIDSLFPYLQKIFIDEVIEGNAEKYVILILCSFIILGVIQGFFGYIKEYQFDKFAVTICRQIRRDLYSKFQSFEFAFFDNNNTGELLSRIIEDVDVVWDTLSFGMRLIIEAVILFILCVSIMSTINFSLTVLCVCILVPVIFIAKKMDKKFWEVYSQISDMTAEINSTVQQDVSGIRLVKAFAREKYEISKFLKTNNKFYDLNVEQARVLGFYGPIVEFLTNCTPILIIVYGGYLCITNQITLGDLVAFTSYVFSLSWCVRNLGGLINMLSQNKASMSKIRGILNRKPKIKSKENAYNPKYVNGDIEFRNVSFSYNNEEILHNVSLKIMGGSKVAIMGATGAGKSTLLALIGRYYDVSEGEVLVDNVNVKDWNIETLRANMSVVFQDTFLFSDTIKNNIQFGNEVDEISLITATKESEAYSFIEDMPNKFETMIGERGVGLSGGQKQRLAIARAIIRNTPIVIFDDATSALDMETEFNVLNNLRKGNKKSTSFIIAHRISAVKDADLIIFMKNGQIVEQGTHNSLIKLRKNYYNIYSHQFQDFENLELEVN